MFGVSPKFFVVRAGEDFTVDDYIGLLGRLKSLGLESFQGEIFRSSQLEDWERNARRLEKRRAELGLRQDMFVAHFLIGGSLSSGSLTDQSWDGYFSRTLDMLSAFGTLRTVCVPTGKYTDDGTLTREMAESLMEDRLIHYASMAEEQGLNFAVEVITGSLLGYDRLAEIRRKYHLGNFGLNLDTGHANIMMGKEISSVCSMLPVYGTHIKDNDGRNPDELRPGKGTIDWKELVASLERSGYTGSYDFELSSPDDAEYPAAEKYLDQFINGNKTGGNL